MKLKFMTLNVWHGGRLFEPMIKFIKAEEPDIIVMQEAYQDARPELEPRFRTLTEVKQALGYKYGAFAPCFKQIMPDLAVEQGMAIASRFPLTEVSQTFMLKPYDDHYIDDPANFPTASRCLQHVIATTPAGPINIFNFQGVWDLDGDNYSAARARMADVIIEGVRNVPKTILAGDTNARPTNRAIKRIEAEANLVNLFGQELTSTFNMNRKTNPGYATSVVDMIFTSHDLKNLDRSCPNVDISDHLPLIATFEV